jgi:hypothetical protein
MPTLRELREAHRRSGAALRTAEDRLGQARDRARSAIEAVSDLERRAIDTAVDPAVLDAAQDERTAAMADLAVVESELRPADLGERPAE